MTEQELNSLKRKFGKRVEKIREGKKMTFAEVEAGCSIEATRISKIEKGYFNVSLATIVELAKGLGVHPSELFE